MGSFNVCSFLNVRICIQIFVEILIHTLKNINEKLCNDKVKLIYLIYLQHPPTKTNKFYAQSSLSTSRCLNADNPLTTSIVCLHYYVINFYYY